MALSIYLGIMGSGKSYELVSQVVLPALLDGRRVVTNIEGLDSVKISHYLDKDIEHLLVFVDDVAPASPSFWFHPDTNPSAITQPGDLVVLDEAWKLFPAGAKLDPAVLEYFRKHRHYTDAAGVSSDIALAFQLFTDIHRAIRGVAATTIETRKMTMLGRPKNYRVRIYEGAANPQQRSVQPAAIHIRKYSPLIFPLYSSFAAKAGIEKKSGRQASLLSNSLLVFWLPLCLLLACWGGWYLYKVFVTPLNDAVSAESASSVATNAKSRVEDASRVGPAAVKAISVSTASSALPSSAQYVGQYYAGTERIFIFKVDSAYRYATHRDFKRVIDYATFVAFELPDGTILSDVYRPVATRNTTNAPGGSTDAQNSSSSAATSAR